MHNQINQSHIKTDPLYGPSPAPFLYVHHSQVPQSIVKSNPAEWYYPSSEDTYKLYSSKKIPTFTPNAKWTNQEHFNNFKNYQKQIDDLRAQHNKVLMSAKDLRYIPVPAGRGPLDPEPIARYPFGSQPSKQIIDAQGNYVNDATYQGNTNNGTIANEEKGNEEKGNESKKDDRVTYDTSQDKSGDAFSYNSDLEDRIYGFKHSTVSDLRDWSYDPYKAAQHPDYATRQGNVASWDRVEGIPTVRKVTPIRDGDRYFARTTTIPDYSAPLEKFTHAKNNNTNRLPNSSGNVTVADLEASGLLSKPQTIRYESNRFGENDDGTWGYARRQSSEENARTARLQDLFTDRLLVPGKVDRSVQVSKLLSEAIGDARRNAILNTAARINFNNRSFGRNIVSPIGTHTLGRLHLAGVDNLSLPITFVDDVLKEGKRMSYTGDGLYTHLAGLYPMSSVDPRYKMYRNDGIIRVFTDSDHSSWTPGSSKIDLSGPDQPQRNVELLDRMRTASKDGKFNIGRVIGADYHHNDFPANGYRGDIRNALLHEGIHAATGFNSNLIDSLELRNKKKLERDMLDMHDENSSNKNHLLDVWHKINKDREKLESDPASRTTALAATLGVSRDDPNMTSRGYASNSEAEMLRALHHAKSGFARHLISENKLPPKAVAEAVQNPDKFLDFMQGVYRGSIQGHNDDPTSYSFPSSMSQVGTEREMARSIAGIQPLVQTLLDERRRERSMLLKKIQPDAEIEDADQIKSPIDNHLFRNWNGDPHRIQWKDMLYTPEEQLYNFRNHIWPQVRNNNTIMNNNKFSLTKLANSRNTPVKSTSLSNKAALSTMIKQAMPFVPLASKTGLHAISTSPKMTVPSKSPAKLNINIKNQQQSDKFPHTLFENNNQNIPQQYSNISQFIQQYPPTPAGVPYRRVNTVSNQDGLWKTWDIWDNINDYTDLLNKSKASNEKLSPIAFRAANLLSDDISSNTPIYQVDGRDAVNWLYGRRGLQFTDEQWNRANKARQSVTSQLGKLPQSIYYAWSDNNNTNAYSMNLSGNKDENNQFFNVFNPNYFDQPYSYDDYNGYDRYRQHGKLQEPWQRFMNFQEAQDHELSHSFNNITPVTLQNPDRQWIWDGLNSGYKDHMFFRKTNNPEQPYYDDDMTSKRVQKFQNIFNNTYLERPSEYIGAMSRVKRYGAELGFDTTSKDPTTARNAMIQTLHYLARHEKPEELTPEQQRIRSWIRTAAINYWGKHADNKDPYFKYIEDVQSPLYKDILDFMTDSTIQGLVRTNPNNLNNIHLT